MDSIELINPSIVFENIQVKEQLKQSENDTWSTS